jgi:hypothetical protein
MGFAILAVLIGGTTLSTGTTAFFTFTSWVNANVFQSGTVSLVASRTSTTELAVDRLLPGDILTRRLTVENPTSRSGGPLEADCGGVAAIDAVASGTFTATPRSAARCTARAPPHQCRPSLSTTSPTGCTSPFSVARATPRGRSPSPAPRAPTPAPPST